MEQNEDKKNIWQSISTFFKQIGEKIKTKFKKEK